MTAPTNPWSELHPSIEVVQDELRRLRYEQAMATIKERQRFIDDLKQAMSTDRRFRDTRPRTKRVYRRSPMADFTAKQIALAERILDGITNQSAGDTRKHL